MVYGICFCPVSRKEDLKNSKVAGWLQSNSWVKIRWKSAAFSRMLFRLKDADGGREREPVSEAQRGQRFRRLGSSGPLTKHHFHQHAAEVHDFTACVRRLVITVKELFNPLCLYSEQNTIWTRCHMMLLLVWCSTPWTVGCSSKRYNTCMIDRRSGDEAAMTCLSFIFLLLDMFFKPLRCSWILWVLQRSIRWSSPSGSRGWRSPSVPKLTRCSPSSALPASVPR